MGSYNNHTKVIIISPRLDNANIPLYYLEYVVYHEMVHAVVGTRISPSGRRDVHGRDFKRLERLFDKYKEAIKFESTFPW
jgi:predicted metal-dependent hydrolase